MPGWALTMYYKVGFAAANSHDIIPVDRCPILDPGLSGAFDAAWALAEPLIAIGKPLDIQITATDNGLDIDIRGSGPLPAAMIARLSRIAEQHRLARLTRHGELVLMRMPPMIVIGSAKVSLPPGSFLQATVAGEEALAALVASIASGRNISPTCSAESGRSRCGLQRNHEFRHSTAMPEQLPHCRRRRHPLPD